MLRSQYHKGCAVQSIRAGGVNGDLLISSLNLKIYLGTVGFADPLALHLFNLLRPV